MTPEQLGITQEQYDNLSKTADLLEAVNEDGFSMERYAKPDGYVEVNTSQVHKEGEYGDDFVYRETGIMCYVGAWDWLFNPAWAETDNTALGASKRIRHFLDKGAPDDAHAQMCGNAPLCYED